MEFEFQLDYKGLLSNRMCEDCAIENNSIISISNGQLIHNLMLSHKLGIFLYNIVSLFITNDQV